MFFIVKRLFIIATVFSLLFSVFLTDSNILPVNSLDSLKVVIDAGHGGKDVGTKGATTGVLESELNLSYAITLGEYFKKAGFFVVLTRQDENSLSDSGLGFHKKQDMEKRRQIIEQAKPDLVISVHMNEFLGDSRQSGAQVFYQKECKNSQNLSSIMQEELNKINKKSRLNVAGDFYILKNTSTPSVIVECGFLSNNEEEYLLQTLEHREKICYTIFLGAMRYFYS